MPSLTQDYVEKYRRDGYLFPLDVFSNSEVSCMLTELEAIETTSADNLSYSIPQYLRSNCYFLLPFVHQAALHNDLLDKVESILGPNILIYGAEFFIKEPHTHKIVSWHQDLTYWGIGETDDELTAWVALSEVNVKSGCMRFLPGSHKQRIQPHKDTFDDNNLLSRGQEVAVEVNESDAVNIELEPGQVSFHHGRMFHASGPNRSDNRRIGLVIRYITPEVTQSGARGYAMAARGNVDNGNWTLVTPPRANFEPTKLELYDHIRKEHVKVLMKGAEGKSIVYG